MAMNIFEGARRISWAIAIIIIVIVMALLYDQFPCVPGNYKSCDLSDFLVPTFWVLLGLWAFTYAIGWIVRGFLGIPRGQDKK